MGLHRSWRIAKASHCVAVLESLKREKGERAAAEDSSVSEMPVPWLPRPAAAVEWG